jgi:hypothetical protein
MSSSRKLFLCMVFGLVAGTSSLLAPSSFAGILYPDPVGGWNYTYNGVGAGTTLDGSWVPGLSTSQNYDGSAIGGTLAVGTNAPGGASALTDGDGTTFLRLQDPGDPRPTYPDSPGSGNNRRIKIVRNTGSGGLGLGTTLLDSGVTLSFRARLSTAATGVIDDRYPTATAGNLSELGGQPVAAWAAGGNGAVTSTQGNGMFSIRQSGGGGKLISFSLALTSDDDNFTTGTNLLTSSGLVTNLKNGTAVTANVDIGNTAAGATVNVVPIADADLDDWHEFWITIVGDTSGGGTHKVSVYADGSLTPTIFNVTAGNGGSGATPVDVLALGDASTGQMWAFDTDFASIKSGVVIPTPEPSAFILVAIGVMGIGCIGRRRVNQKSRDRMR